jgi:hypothetical protein
VPRPRGSRPVGAGARRGPRLPLWPCCDGQPTQAGPLVRRISLGWAGAGSACWRISLLVWDGRRLGLSCVGGLLCWSQTNPIRFVFSGAQHICFHRWKCYGPFDLYLQQCVARVWDIDFETHYLVTLFHFHQKWTR